MKNQHDPLEEYSRHNTSSKVWSSNTTVAMSFIQFVVLDALLNSKKSCVESLHYIIAAHRYIVR